MTFQHSTLWFSRDLPEHGLKAGDLGAVVDVYPQMASRSNS